MCDGMLNADVSMTALSVTESGRELTQKHIQDTLRAKSTFPQRDNSGDTGQIADSAGVVGRVERPRNNPENVAGNIVGDVAQR